MKQRDNLFFVLLKLDAAQYRSLRKELERLKCLAHSRNGKLSTNFRLSSAAEMTGLDAAWQMLDFGKLDLN